MTYLSFSRLSRNILHFVYILVSLPWIWKCISDSLKYCLLMLHAPNSAFSEPWWEMGTHSTHSHTWESQLPLYPGGPARRDVALLSYAWPWGCWTQVFGPLLQDGVEGDCSPNGLQWRHFISANIQTCDHRKVGPLCRPGKNGTWVAEVWPSASCTCRGPRAPPVLLGESDGFWGLWSIKLHLS